MQSLQNGRGRLLVLGSAHLFSDQYLDKEENGRLQEVLWQLMTSDDITLNAIDAEDPEVYMSCSYVSGFVETVDQTLCLVS